MYVLQLNGYHQPLIQSLSPLYTQARIAMINTLLTAIGMWLLKIPGIAILSLFVLSCR